jgi:hypothetical protein
VHDSREMIIASLDLMPVFQRGNAAEVEVCVAVESSTARAGPPFRGLRVLIVAQNSASSETPVEVLESNRPNLIIEMRDLHSVAFRFLGAAEYKMVGSA